MNPLPKALLEATTPSRSETIIGKIPLLGWAIAHAMQDQRFHPIENTYKQILTSRGRDEALAEWSPDRRPDAARMMTILEEEFGWKPPAFIPSDPCLVAFWAHEDGLDDVAAIRRIEHEWGIEFSDEELAKLQDYDLQAFIVLIKSKSHHSTFAEKIMHPPEFIFDHPSGLRISRGLREADVSTLEGVGRRDMRTGYVWYDLPRQNSESDNILMSLCFYFGTLDSISIAVSDPDLGSSWSDWSEEKERARADRTEAWLAAQGYPTGTYAWGQIWAAYDPKGGGGSAGIRYNREQAGGGQSATRLESK